jgi:phenylacetaldehyde dehydrogenase
MTTVHSAPVSVLERVTRFLATPHRLYIGGAWCSPATGATFETIDPATLQPLATIASAGPADVDLAVRAARRALTAAEWGRITPYQRSQLIHRLADIIERDAEEFAQLETLDNGKPLSMSRVADIPGTVAILRYFAGWPTKLEGRTIPVSPTRGRRMLNYTVLEPVGVVAQIVPWNFPLSMAAWKLGPALAAGCTSILKPAEQTPLTALRLAYAIEEAGFPPGVVNVLTGFGETGAALVAHDGVDKVAFTGSTEVGKHIVRSAAGNLKRVSLELGGKSPNIVFPDADVAQVAKGAAEAIFFNQGQVCTAGSRLYVHADCFDDVLDAVRDEARSIRVGPGIDPATQMGPLVSEDHLAHVRGFIENGVAHGARVIAGGGRPAHTPRGNFLEPTIFATVVAARRNLWPRARRHVVAERRRTDRARERFTVRSRGRDLDARHRPGASRGGRTASRQRLDQLLQRRRSGVTVRRLQTVRLGPRNGAASPRQLYRDEERLGQCFLMRADGRD